MGPQGPGPRAHGPGPWAHELEACGVSSIRGFEATSFRRRPLGNDFSIRNNQNPSLLSADGGIYVSRGLLQLPCDNRHSEETLQKCRFGQHKLKSKHWQMVKKRPLGPTQLCSCWIAKGSPAGSSLLQRRREWLPFDLLFTWACCRRLRD